MLISCRFSIVGLHLLILTHVAQSFVLLTANVDDVKKIARKFVSDSLAEKIVDFIARATETMAINANVSQEKGNNADVRDNSQVSAENRMYDAETKSKEEIVIEKVPAKIPRKTSEKKRHKIEKPNTHKTRKEPKLSHGKSRYIIQQTENKFSLTTEKKSLSIEVEHNKMKEQIQLLDDNYYNTPDGKKKSSKKQKKKKEVRTYKLLSGFDTVEDDAAEDGTPDNKRANDNARLLNARAMDEKKALSLLTEETAATSTTDDGQHVNERQIEKVVTEFDQHEVKDEKTDEFDHDENKIIEKPEKVPTSESGFHLTERDVDAEDWWKRGLPAYSQKMNSSGKSWF